MPTLQIGPYEIGRAFSSYPRSQKLSWWSSFDIKRGKVRGLKLYRSHEPVVFMDQPHEVILGVVQDSVWSLSVLFAYKTEDLMADALLRVTDYFKTQFGEHASDTQYPFRWRAASADITISVETATGIGVAFHFFTLTLSSA